MAENLPRRMRMRMGRMRMMQRGERSTRCAKIARTICAVNKTGEGGETTEEKDGGNEGQTKEMEMEINEEGMVAGVRWDPAQLRWVRDKRKGVKAMATNTTLKGDVYTIWPVCHTFLAEKGLKSIEPAALMNEMKTNQQLVLVDVRLENDFAIEHAEGAINAPLFCEMQKTDSIFDVVKRLALGGMAMKATMRNPDFMTYLPEDKSTTMVVMCSIGGTLDTFIRRPGRKPYPDPDRSFGRESRSLKACFEMMQNGYTDVRHLSGGLQMWRKEGFPVEDSGN